MVKMEKKVSRFSPIALLLATVTAIALLLSATLAYGQSSGCTWVTTQGQPTTKEECGEPTCTPSQASQANSQLVSAGYFYDCEKTSTTPAYSDVYFPPCYYDEFFSEQICPPEVYTWVPAKEYTYAGSCWSDPLYKTCQLNCQKVTVPGDTTSKLQCPAVAPAPAPTPSPVANPTATPTPQTCVKDMVISNSKSCSGTCNQAAIKICNSLGTGTYDSTITDVSCTLGCTVSIPSSVTPTPTPDSCAQISRTCGVSATGETITKWSYADSKKDCVKSVQQCNPGEKCNSATGMCEIAKSCQVSCSGDIAINWHLSSANQCVKDAQSDCAAQGKVCQQNVGCVAPTAKQDCTGQGCPGGYYCYYGSDV